MPHRTGGPTKMKGKWAVGTGIALALAAGAGLYVVAGDRPSAPIHADADDETLVSAGRDLYAQQCAACHGARLEGQRNWRSPLPDGGRPAPPHDADGHTWHHPDQLLFEITKKGGQRFSPPDYQNNMPAFADSLSDDEIIAVLAFIKSTWPPKIRAAQAGVNRKAAEREERN